MDWAERHLQAIRVEHLAGVSNAMADWLSRQHLLEVEWQLNPEVFRLMAQKFGLPVVDLFATGESAQVPRFFARTSELGAEAVNALQCLWLAGLPYAFPPVALIQGVLQRVKHLGVEVILIALKWPCHPWFPEPLRLSVQPHWVLPVWTDLLLQGPAVHPWSQLFHLTVWRLSGACCRTQAIPTRSPGCCWHPGGPRPPGVQFHVAHLRLVGCRQEGVGHRGPDLAHPGLPPKWAVWAKSYPYFVG